MMQEPAAGEAHGAPVREQPVLDASREMVTVALEVAVAAGV